MFPGKLTPRTCFSEFSCPLSNDVIGHTVPLLGVGCVLPEKRTRYRREAGECAGELEHPRLRESALTRLPHFRAFLRTDFRFSSL